MRAYNSELALSQYLNASREMTERSAYSVHFTENESRMITKVRNSQIAAGMSADDLGKELFMVIRNMRLMAQSRRLKLYDRRTFTQGPSIGAIAEQDKWEKIKFESGEWLVQQMFTNPIVCCLVLLYSCAWNSLRSPEDRTRLLTTSEI